MVRFLILVGRDALQPSHGGDHRQQEMQFRMLRHLRLNEQRGDAGIEARRETEEGQRQDVLRELRGVLRARGERMPIGDEEKAFVLVLQFDPILESTVVVAQMQLARGPNAGQQASILYRTAHACDPNKALMIRPTIRKAGLNSHPKSPNTDNPNAMKRPTGSIFSKRTLRRGGSNAASTRPPSSGGMGNRLNSARTTLLKIPAWAMSVIQRPKVWLPLIRRIAPSTAHHNTAMKRFAAGPASATTTIARRGLRSALVATGTGFAHPNSSPPTASRRPGTSTVPMGSMWRSGFKLRRPSISAVRSTKYLAIQP